MGKHSIMEDLEVAAIFSERTLALTYRLFSAFPNLLFDITIIMVEGSVPTR
jgi:predicted ester cyclase